MFTAVCLVVCACRFYIHSLGRLAYNCLLVGPEVKMRWAFCTTFGCQIVNEVSKRFNIKGVVQMGDGSSCGIVCGNAQALVLDDLEIEVV
jgi:hypothetical protein